MTIKKIKLKQSYRGFTLAELVIIILIIGIFAVLASSRTDIGIGKIRQRIAIDQITSDIDLVRSSYNNVAEKTQAARNLANMEVIREVFFQYYYRTHQQRGQSVSYTHLTLPTSSVV